MRMIEDTFVGLYYWSSTTYEILSQTSFSIFYLPKW